MGRFAQVKNAHAGDHFKLQCKTCGGFHYVCPVRPEGCSYGRRAHRGTGWTDGGWRASSWWYRHILVLRDGAKCYSCGQRPNRTLDNRLEIQHILPVSKGGSNCLHNLVFLCHKCHVSLAKGKVYGGIPGASGKA